MYKILGNNKRNTSREKGKENKKKRYTAWRKREKTNIKKVSYSVFRSCLQTALFFPARS
jgi:hypothetical protein